MSVVFCVVCPFKKIAGDEKVRNIHVDLALAEYTVRVSKLLLTNCVQANDNTLEVLPHIILYLSTRRPQNIRSPGHVYKDIGSMWGLGT